MFSKCRGEFEKYRDRVALDQQTKDMSEAAAKVSRSLAETCDLFDKCKVDKEKVISLSTHLESLRLAASSAAATSTSTSDKFRLVSAMEDSSVEIF